MEAKDLRIGNFVYLTDKEKVWEILDGYEIDKCEENPFTQPIPLTEEWLLKFGFTRHHADYYNDVILLKDVFNLDNGEQYDCLKVKIYPHELGSAQSVKGDLHIKHVHQLQNLYFALTGEELEII